MMMASRFADLWILLPFDAKSVQGFHQIQSWNSLASFTQANATANIGDYALVRSISVGLSPLLIFSSV